MTRILVIDDETDFLASLELSLVLNGFDVTTTETGENGVTLAQQLTPDLVIVDLRMEPMDGFTVCRVLRDSPNQLVSDVAILVLTRSDSPEIRSQALNGAGSDDFVAKPFELATLMDRIQNLLRLAGSRPPYWHKRGKSLLRLTCVEGQPIHYASEPYGTRRVTQQNLRVNPNIQAGAPWHKGFNLLGEVLWKDVFTQHAEVQGEYDYLRGQMHDDRRRLHLRFGGNSEFLLTPLEFLYDADGAKEFVVLRHPLSRSVLHARRRSAALSAEFLNDIWSSHRPLKVLAIASNVYDEELSEIPEVDTEVGVLKQHLRDWFGGRGLSVEVTVLDAATANYSTVVQKLDEFQYDIIHYSGHCVIDAINPDRSGLPFWNGKLPSDGIEILNFRKLEQLFEKSRPSFVYLSACHGVQAADARRGKFFCLADAVLRSGVPAVLGFRWAVSDSRALALAAKFYESLGKQGELDVALLDARRALAAQDSNDPAWLSPVLVVQE